MFAGRFQKLFTIEDVVTRSGLDATLADAVGPLLDVALPVDHLDFLKCTNGVEAYGGYVRLFGFGPQSAVDFAQWNSENFWKFAWAGRVTPYFCFGETGWGDQFAYDIGQLNAGDPSVYFIEGLAMQPKKIAADFSEFFASEFLPICRLPYDEMTVAVRRTIGDLLPGEHVAYSPSPIVGGTELIENVVKLASRSAMIIAGDLALGVDALHADASISHLEQYNDADGCMRIKIVAR
ncbi:SMI1/KNR4 family protein [Rhizobium sp. K102]|uniref:SMI1/KNR4 family protein n=1 Tax=Rhizobium sp. K102 TaxID=2918527 RepID=UPI001EFAE242|nr:SMI1/KNR4 family protein [Rhizobium sp. K102]ULR43206.1 SMI1/KNR4 family protein [Rhizobium sp. K102]